METKLIPSLKSTETYSFHYSCHLTLGKKMVFPNKSFNMKYFRNKFSRYVSNHITNRMY